MAYDPITEPFVLTEEGVENLIKALNDPTPKKEIISNRYEEGERILDQYFGHSDE